jgi:hypothetical protein
VYVACLYADADNFSSSESKNFLFGELSCTDKKKDACEMASLIFFSCKKARQTKIFCLRVVKNRQHQHIGKQHTQEKFQDAAVSVKEVIKLFRGVNLSGTHCIIRGHQ